MAVPIKEILAVAKFLNSPAGKQLIQTANSQIGGGSGSTQTQSSSDSKDIENMTQQEKLDKVREIMVGDPTDYVIRGAGAAAAGISDFVGNKAVTDANHLASAILAANRTNSAAQENLYGPSRKEKTANMWSQEKLRRGENVKNATDQVSDVIRNLSGLYAQRDDVARAMQAQMVTQAPGSFYNYANSLQRAQQQSKKGKN